MIKNLHVGWKLNSTLQFQFQSQNSFPFILKQDTPEQDQQLYTDLNPFNVLNHKLATSHMVLVMNKQSLNAKLGIIQNHSPPGHTLSKGVKLYLSHII